MRGGRLGIVGIGALCLPALLTSGPALAAPSVDYGPASSQCTITDPEIDEVSGLVVVAGGDMLLVEDSTPEPRPGSTSILMYRMDQACVVATEATEFDQDPRDIEDLAFRDNTVWFADIGDNAESRSNVALISVGYDPADPPVRSTVPVVFRLGYPDGPHDAEALLLAPDGTPYIVTKDLLGQSAVYRPAGPLDPAAEVAMDKVADVDLVMTGTPGGPVGRLGQVLVTGGAVSADGALVALRTYTDAYVWALSGSDVAGALRADPIAVVALPDAPQGEAISFAADSRSLIVGSEGVNSVITIVPAASQAPETTDVTAADEGHDASTAQPPSPPTGTVLAGLIAATAVTGLIWVVLRLRRRRA